ncbi:MULTISPECIES: Pycsar system effector family protein [Streptomyces]|uniref:Pycsar effector protein domain-containing protein n=1 Tax=Streptomyces albus (strain ATCC 21838 / DSM 41398 / FERM P-419 / JCM 4703 / NBRC 107858) TaxID=1081613 RepID=A0A0B5ES59_STRA4|nr:Pycsar system effector family protein [Streptomyces sp. SCSIO ZS0520]AJE82120.1 hypothetical protein SLNWT_1744 [Streptomyces albus]AOU76436.1 hypothetical protein SLNHY_1745 [Streptomyces albus]AYN32222.1 hypothetical protein DUI70_1719 [Streptomyces albus]
MATTTGPAAPGDEAAQQRIAALVAGVQSDLARTESKAGLLLALSAAALAALLSAAVTLDLPAAVAVTGALAAAALLAATALLLLAVRPDLTGTGWTSWPALGDEELRAQLLGGYRVEHLRFLAALALRKFRLIRAAVDCLLAGLGLVAVAGVLAGVG